MDNNGIEYQFGNNEKNIINVNDKIILSSYLEGKPQVQQIWEVNDFVVKTYGMSIENITNTIRRY